MRNGRPRAPKPPRRAWPSRNADGEWKQNGRALLIEVNDCYAEYEARIDGDEMKGQFTSVDGARADWTARRNRNAVSATVNPR